MKLKYILLLFIMTTVLFAQAQEIIRLEGIVLNDTIDKAQLNIVNITLKKGTVTTAQGKFTIEARENDTINVSAVQYESRQFVVNPTIFKRRKITLYLIPIINQLETVNISNIDLTGDITKDVGSTRYKVKITPSQLGIPENTAPERTVEERRYHTAISSGGGIPLDGLINSITGRLKMLKKHIEVSRFKELVQDSRYKFTDSLYMKELDIPEELIEDFVYYIFENPKAKKLVDVNNVLGLFEFMKEESVSYKALKSKE